MADRTYGLFSASDAASHWTGGGGVAVTISRDSHMYGGPGSNIDYGRFLSTDLVMSFNRPVGTIINLDRKITVNYYKESLYTPDPITSAYVFGKSAYRLEAIVEVISPGVYQISGTIQPYDEQFDFVPHYIIEVIPKAIAEYLTGIGTPFNIDFDDGLGRIVEATFTEGDYFNPFGSLPPSSPSPYSFREAENASMRALSEYNAALADARAGLSLEARDERARLEGIERTTNVSGAYGYKTDAAMAEAERRAGIERSTNVSGAYGYRTDAAMAEAARRADSAGGRASPSSSSPGFGPGSMADARAADRASMPGYAGSRPYSGYGGLDSPSERVSMSDRSGSRGDRDSAGYGGGGAGSSGGGATSGGSSGGTRSSNPSRDTYSSNGGYPDPNRTSGMPGGIGSQPVLLDLSGSGLSIDPLSSSSHFVDLDGDGYQHRTAWAGAGTGVLVLDADGDGKISRSSEFVFTEWDQTATGDLEAIKSVFDTNHNGLLDAGDDRWAEFKVMVDGQLVSLASLGIASIELTPTGSGQNFADGSAITGTAQYTRTDGTTGTVGDAVLVSDANGYMIESTTVTNADGSKTTDLAGYGRDGTLAFRNRIVTSADGLTKTTQFDDDGNGTYERSQSDVVTVTAGVHQRVVSNFNTDGSLADRTTTMTSADKTTVTTTLDQDGDGAGDQTQVYVKNVDGSASTTIAENSANGTLLRKVVTTASADGLSKTVQKDSTGSGVYDLISTETTVIADDGSRTKTVEDRSSGGSLIASEQSEISSDGRTRTVSHDRDGDGV